MIQEMPVNPHQSAPLGLPEILAAASPGASEKIRKEIRERLESCTSTDDAVIGAKKFLEDNGHDFDALYRFTAGGDMVRKKEPRSSWQKYAVAASLICFVFMGWQYRQKLKRHDRMTDIVFHEPGLPVFASMDGERDFHEMMNAFKMQDAKEGLTYLNALKTRYAQRDTLAYFGGWLHYMRRDYDSAAYCFSIVAEDSTATYQHKAELMEAAALMLGGQRETAKDRLKSIQEDNDSPYKLEAEKIGEF
jgi:hypothetical protein